MNDAEYNDNCREAFFCGFMMAGPQSMESATERCIEMGMTAHEAMVFIDDMVQRRFVFYGVNLDTLESVPTEFRLPWKEWLKKAEKPMSMDELSVFIKDMAKQDHDYESACQMPIAATIAVFTSACHEMRVSGMQDNMIRSVLSRHLKDGF